MIPFEHLLC